MLPKTRIDALVSVFKLWVLLVCIGPGRPYGWPATRCGAVLHPLDAAKRLLWVAEDGARSFCLRELLCLTPLQLHSTPSLRPYRQA